MLKFLKRKSDKATVISNEAAEQKSSGWLQKLKSGLSRTRQQFGNGLANLVLGKKQIDDELFEEIETQLLLADVGAATCQAIMAQLTEQVNRKALADPNTLLEQLRLQLSDLLQKVEQPLVIEPSKKPFVILMVGINGAGKTTTIGKLAKQLQNNGHSVMLAAGDTFRAAAVEQLQVWGERNNIPVVAQQTGADSASVIFDAIQSAKARGTDVVIADTAGRLHTQSNLMAELEKVRRVIKKCDDQAPHEVMLVLDASIGQNAINQAKQFKQAVDVSGICLTKLDGTAKGGVIFAIANELAIPIRLLGVGEGIEDLRPFNANQFVDALFDDD